MTYIKVTRKWFSYCTHLVKKIKIYIYTHSTLYHNNEDPIRILIEYITEKFNAFHRRITNGAHTKGKPNTGRLFRPSFKNPIRLSKTGIISLSWLYHSTRWSSCSYVGDLRSEPPCFIIKSFLHCNKADRSVHIFICRMLGAWFSRIYFCSSFNAFPKFSCSWIFAVY